MVYVAINTTIILVWTMTADGGFFWPVFPMVGWGIGVVMNAWDVWRGAFTETQVAHEMTRLRRRG